MTSVFEEYYSAPVLPGPRIDPKSGTAPGGAWALGGCVLTPEKSLDPGWVIIDGTQVADVGTQQPKHVYCLSTGGVILPGLIDLHGHPTFNVFSAWEPPHWYPNRKAWRDSSEYQAVVKASMEELIEGDERFNRVLARYGEIRAVVGGTTAIQGDNSGHYSSWREPIVRHVDLGPRAAALVFPLANEVWNQRAQIKEGLENQSITAFYAHIAEGVDNESANELSRLDDEGLLTSATVLIHGTALDEQQLGKVRDVGAKIVWSPQSNLRLYGRTTRAATAWKIGIPLGLGADWLPSGSVGLLAEMKVARRLLAEQGESVEPRKLVEMATSRAAEIADLDELGRLTTGRPADLLVLERHHQDPYESICLSGRASVELVVIDGRLVYGRDDWFGKLRPDAKIFGRNARRATGERVWAWGKRMRLDLGSPADPAIFGHHGPLIPRRLSEIRAEIVKRYPRTGPIFA